MQPLAILDAQPSSRFPKVFTPLSDARASFIAAIFRPFSLLRAFLLLGSSFTFSIASLFALTIRSCAILLGAMLFHTLLLLHRSLTFRVALLFTLTLSGTMVQLPLWFPPMAWFCAVGRPLYAIASLGLVRMRCSCTRTGPSSRCMRSGLAWAATFFMFMWLG